MFGFGKRKTPWKVEYDPKVQRPVLRCSICTGEQTACLQDLHSGALTEIMAIRTPAELEAFQAACGVDKVEKVY